MGRYGRIEVLAEAEVPTTNLLLKARMSWIGHGIVAFFLLGWSALFPLFIWYQGLLNFNRSLFDILFSTGIAIFCFVAVLISSLAGLMFLSSALAALRSSNWILIATADGLFIKLRSYMDYRLPKSDKIVAFIPKPEIKKLTFIQQQNRKIGNKDIPADTHLSSDIIVEIQTYGSDLAMLADSLTSEKQQYSKTWFPGVRTKAKGSALQVHANENKLRIDWHTRRGKLRPGATSAEPILSRLLPTDDMTTPEELPIDSLPKPAQKERLKEMVLRGDTIDAIALCRQIYGLSLTDAHKFVTEL
jgi:hypothetical protein